MDSGYGNMFMASGNHPAAPETSPRTLPSSSVPLGAKQNSSAKVHRLPVQAPDLGDGNHPALAVGQAGQLHNNVYMALEIRVLRAVSE